MRTEPKAGGPKGFAKRALGPFERRLDFIVERAVDRSMQQQSLAIQEALRADVATLVELTYELQRAVDQLTGDPVAHRTA